MFKNRIFIFSCFILFVVILIVFIFVLRTSNTLSIGSLFTPNIDYQKNSEYIDQNTALIQDKYEIRLGFLGNLFLNKIHNNQITVGNETINSVELEFLVNSNNKVKTLNAVVVQPFWNDEKELLFPDNATKLFENGNYYSITFGDFNRELTPDEKLEYCEKGNNLKAASLEQCMAQVSFLHNQSNEKIKNFINSDSDSLKIEGLWLLKAVDQSQIDLSKSIQQ